MCPPPPKLILKIDRHLPLEREVFRIRLFGINLKYIIVVTFYSLAFAPRTRDLHTFSRFECCIMFKLLSDFSDFWHHKSDMRLIITRLPKKTIHYLHCTPQVKTQYVHKFAFSSFRNIFNLVFAPPPLMWLHLIKYVFGCVGRDG